MCEYKGKLLVGKDMAVLVAVGSVDTPVTLDKRYGNIIGISIGESYLRSQLGQVNLSLKASSRDIVINTPLTQFLPDGERQMWPCNISAGTDILATLTIRVAGLVVATPIPLIFHTDNNDTCSK